MNNKLFYNPEQLRLVSNLAAHSARQVFRLMLLVALALGIGFPARPADAPAWMRALVNAPLPPHDEKTDAVLVYSEEILNVQGTGKVRETDRLVYRILRPDGRGYGKIDFPFDPDHRIVSLHGWCIPAQGKDFEVKEKDVPERGYLDVEGGELVSDLRVKAMSIPAPAPGNLIGYEVEYEQRPYILEDEWFFQRETPVGDGRYTLQLPAGWEYKAVWVNHPEMAPVSIGNNQWQWQLKNIPEIRVEEEMPPWKGVAGLMIIALLPPGGASHGFLSWSEMGAWYVGLTQGRRDASPEIKQKVAELTAGATTPLAKMQALAAFIQKDIRYVAILLGIGGVQPHAARDVFAHRYGDCKDKATLLSSMLKEAGIDAYYVVIHTQRGGVIPATPPHLGSFNHVILAIHLPDGISDGSLQATVQHPKLGKLLFFDPTDELTPFGELRGPLQSNYGLLVTADGGELTLLPQLATSANGVTRTAKLSLDDHGNLQGEVHEVRVGDAASGQRWAQRDVEKDADKIKPIETLMASSFANFVITKATVTNPKQTSKPFGYDWSFVAQDYAKQAGDLLLVRPRVLGVKTWAVLETKEPRKYPVEFRGPSLDMDKFVINIPAGYVVDDLPPAADVDYSFASYHSKTEAKGSVLTYTRTMEIKELSVPVGKLDQLKAFYRTIAGDERNTAVLKLAAK
jgi:hypothetical protein